MANIWGKKSIFVLQNNLDFEKITIVRSRCYSVGALGMCKGPGGPYRHDMWSEPIHKRSLSELGALEGHMRRKMRDFQSWRVEQRRQIQKMKGNQKMMDLMSGGKP